MLLKNKITMSNVLMIIEFVLCSNGVDDAKGLTVREIKKNYQ